MMRDLGARPPQRHRLVVGHPVADVREELGGARRTGLREQLRDRLITAAVAHPREQHSGHRAREVVARDRHVTPIGARAPKPPRRTPQGALTSAAADETGGSAVSRAGPARATATPCRSTNSRSVGAWPSPT